VATESLYKVRRLNVNLPVLLHEELQGLAQRSGRSMTEIVRTGLSLATLAFTEAEQSNTLVVADAKGNVIKHILLP
jgi:hypothetical protein